jgi:hypothetical protein
MKKVLAVLLFCTLSWSTIRIQCQADVIGTGVGLGLGGSLIPLFMDTGIEGSVYGLPTFKSVGSYRDDATGIVVPYEGKATLRMARAGLYCQLKIPGADMLPIVGALFHPVFHFGSQNGILSVEGTVRPINNGDAIGDSLPVRGSYFMVGFPAYLGPLFIEPGIGSQHIFVPGYANYKNTVDAQIAAGLVF